MPRNTVTAFPDLTPENFLLHCILYRRGNRPGTPQTQGRFAADGRAGLCLGPKVQHRPPACHPRQVPSPLGLAVSSSVTGGGQGAPLAIPGAPGGWYSSSARTSDPRPRKDTHPKRGSALEPKDEALRTLTTNATAQQVEQSTGAPGPRLPSQGLEPTAPPPLAQSQASGLLPAPPWPPRNPL